MTTSCTNDSRDEIIMPQKNMENISKTTARDGDPEMWEKPSENAYALDGYLHIVVGNKPAFIYMGEEIIPSDSDESREALYLYNNGDTGRRRALIYCTVQYDGYTASLVEVSGGDRPRTYFIVFTRPDGSQDVLVNPRPTYGQCGFMHLQATFTGEYSSKN